MRSLRLLCGISPALNVSIPQPEIHKADDAALQVRGGACGLLCEPKSPQKAGHNALETPPRGGHLLCEIWVKFFLTASGK